MIKTTESVGKGHPDKVADAISDAILVENLKQDKSSRVAVETLVCTNKVVVAGEVTSKAKISIEEIIKKVILDIGYNQKGFNVDDLKIENNLVKQSPDINQGVDKNIYGSLGAGDQGIIFGYSTNETEDGLDLPFVIVNDILKKLNEVRENNSILKPDCKSQISILYKDNKPIGVDNIILSTQHAKIDIEELMDYLKKEVIYPILDSYNLKCDKYYINPTGKFLIGGPSGDTGLTGRKIIVDTYGGFAHHGGGAFSGKDPSKVDRSAAYMARYICNNLVRNNLCDKCEIQLAYSIGYPEPVSISLNTFSTEKTKIDLIKLIKGNFDLRVQSLIDTLGLLDVDYNKYNNYSHFSHKSAPWNKIIELN